MVLFVFSIVKRHNLVSIALCFGEIQLITRQNWSWVNVSKMRSLLSWLIILFIKTCLPVSDARILMHVCVWQRRNECIHLKTAKYGGVTWKCWMVLIVGNKTIIAIILEWSHLTNCAFVKLNKVLYIQNVFK